MALLRPANDGEVSVDWTDQREERDFSHEDAEKPVLPDAGVRSQMPYIPSASFMYQHAGDSISVENHQPWIAEEKMENVASAVNAANLSKEAVQSFRQQLAGLQKLAAQKRADLDRGTDQQKRLLLESLKQIRTQQEILRRIILSVKKPAPDRLIYI